MNQNLLDRVLRSPRLPSLPTIALEVIDLVRQDASMDRIAETLRHDLALSSKIPQDCQLRLLRSGPRDQHD